MKLNEEEVKRYARQIMLPEIGTHGQERMKAATVLIVGAGGLGSPASMYLAAAGIGRIIIADADKVALSNLQRQLLHTDADIGRPKVESARESLSKLNPGLEIEPMLERLVPENAARLVSEVDTVVDCCDNFATRYLMNDACVLGGKPYVYGSVYQFEGQASVFGVGGRPCYRCLFREPPPLEIVDHTGAAGIIGPVPGIIGVIQAMEAIKLITGAGETLSGRLLLFDALDMSFRTLNIHGSSDCPLCGDNPSIKELLPDYNAFCRGQE